MDSMEIDDNIEPYKSLTMDGLITRVDFQQQKRPSRRATVCLFLLCAVLLAGNIAQIIYYRIIPNSASADPTKANTLTQGNEHLQNESDIQSTERDQLQMNYDSLNEERQQLEARLSNLTESYSSLTTERDALKASFNNVKNERDQLQISYDSLWKDKEQLQTRYNTLTKEKEQLQTKHSSLAADRQNLQEKVDKMTIKIRGMHCQTDWRKLDTSCYFLSTTKKNWTESRKDCIARGGDLVVIDSWDEQVFLNGLLQTHQNAWIGLSDALNEGTWTWVDKTPVTTTYWQVGQPNNFSGGQDCGEIVRKSSATQTWNDDGCFAQQTWICEN
ncbi:C-type lectin domain family 4 member M-like isoform X2 [Mastacembelus armatus]|uniref:C-type lectin domain family 4 member M-like isoform X2 n=1 Tax=Mastacembelus armatus TaxID=205130 RepID=UPI000E45CFD9|nr:C-type lectin domain family 4 member M-like isoform X2 [Mastacembelus armatus]